MAEEEKPPLGFTISKQSRAMAPVDPGWSREGRMISWERTPSMSVVVDYTGKETEQVIATTTQIASPPISFTRDGDTIRISATVNAEQAERLQATLSDVGAVVSYVLKLGDPASVGSFHLDLPSQFALKPGTSEEVGLSDEHEDDATTQVMLMDRHIVQQALNAEVIELNNEVSRVRQQISETLQFWEKNKADAPK